MDAPASRKHVLFFSNYCDFCRAVLATIAKRGMRADFVTVCVDQDRRNLPAFVDRVPLVLTAGDRRVLADDALMRFLGDGSDAAGGGPDPLEAGDLRCGGGLADGCGLKGGGSFAFLVGGSGGDGWAAGGAQGGGKGFLSVAGAAEHNAGNYGFPPPINAPDDGGAPVGKPPSQLGEPVQVKRGGGGAASYDLDRMRSERDTDMQRIFRSQAGPQEAAARDGAAPFRPTAVRPL